MGHSLTFAQPLVVLKFLFLAPFLVCMNNLPVHPRITLSLFADDVMFHNSSLFFRQVTVICNASGKYFWTGYGNGAQWSTRTSPMRSAWHISSLMNAKLSPWRGGPSNEPNRCLKFNDLMTDIINKACGVRAKLFSMLSWNSHLAVRTKFTLYLLFFWIVITYVVLAWLFTNWHKLSAFQNCML